MGRKGLVVAAVLGLGLVALSVTADVVGFEGDYVFGWEQMLGVAVGMTVAWLAGLRLLGWDPRAERTPASTRERRTAPAPPRRDPARRSEILRRRPLRILRARRHEQVPSMDSSPTLRRHPCRLEHDPDVWGNRTAVYCTHGDIGRAGLYIQH